MRIIFMRFDLIFCFRKRGKRGGVVSCFSGMWRVSRGRPGGLFLHSSLFFTLRNFLSVFSSFGLGYPPHTPYYYTIATFIPIFYVFIL